MFGLDDLLGIAGGVVGGGLDILGGQLGAAQNRQSQRFSADLQREFAQHGIQWRIEDAARAGVHPLAAMGMMPASAQPLAIGDVSGEGFSRMGQKLSGAIDRVKSQEQKAFDVGALQLQAQQIKKSEMENESIAIDLAEKKRSSMTAAPPLGIMPNRPDLPLGQSPNPPIDTSHGVFEMKPPSIMSGEGETQAGRIKGFGEMKLHPRLNFRVPANENQEATWELWNELPSWQKILFLQQNSQIYGPGYLMDLWRVMSGGEPHGTYTGPVTHPDAYTNTLVQPNPLGEAGQRFLDWSKKQARRFKRKFNKFKDQLP
ncbi:MAG: DNA pilot protein [Microviridae sp.]|nr:MAG: DNA pilot protein [Microviridae sp.]